MVHLRDFFFILFFFFNDTATTEIYTLSLHDALPICSFSPKATTASSPPNSAAVPGAPATSMRSEEHTSELQSPCNLVCRLLLETKPTTGGARTVRTSSACLGRKQLRPGRTRLHRSQA